MATKTMEKKKTAAAKPVKAAAAKSVSGTKDAKGAKAKPAKSAVAKPTKTAAAKSAKSAKATPAKSAKATPAKSAKATPAKSAKATPAKSAKTTPAKSAKAPSMKMASKGPASEPHFRPELFFFFRELAANNERAWFEANRERYERDVKAPLLRFVADFGPRLERISKHFVADPRPNGGSIFRIHRDVRFSKDKSPFKTQAAAQFRHAAGRDVHAPGFYLHLEPGRVFAGGGLWHPDAPTLQKVRAAIVEHPRAWGSALRHDPFLELLEVGGDSLKRPPKGFDPEHPLIVDLRRTDFVAMSELSERDACAPDFIDRFAEIASAMAPYMAFLTRAVGLEF